MKIKEKVEFYVNQKVFDYSYGWGKIVKIITTSDSSKEPIIVFINNEGIYNFYDLEGRNVCLINNIIKYRAVNPTLATKEYYLEYFTQEPQIDYTKYIDKWGKFGNSEDKIEFIGVLKDFRETSEGLKYFYPFEDKNIDYEYFEPLSDDEFKNLKNIITVYYEDNKI